MGLPNQASNQRVPAALVLEISSAGPGASMLEVIDQASDLGLGNRIFIQFKLLTRRNGRVTGYMMA
jgi:hypothetical protein